MAETHVCPISPDISVIVPIYNANCFLRKCLDSILDQKGVSIELVLVDDGSTDGSGNVCDDYARRDDRVRVIHQENAGVSAARNTGMEFARGASLLFVDSDDYLLEGALQLLWREQNAFDADFVRAKLAMAYEGTVSNYLGGSDMFRPAVKGFAYIEEIDGKPTLCFMGSSVALLIRSSLLRRHGSKFREDISFGEDIFFILDLMNCGGIYRFVDTVVYIYRRQTYNSLTSTYTPSRSTMLLGALESMDRLRGHLEDEYAHEVVAAAIGDMYTGFLIRYLVSCAADSVANPNGDAFKRFKCTFRNSFPRELLRHYNPDSAKGKSRIIPWLVRLGLTRVAFALCRRKAKKRYRKELAQLRALRLGQEKRYVPK